MIHFVTGGSGSGKSRFAESIICDYYRETKEAAEFDKLIYVATMIPYGEETKQKIMRHREMRKDKGFRTIECYTGLKKLAGVSSCKPYVLLECMSNLAANEMYEPWGAGEHTVEAVMEGITLLNERCRCLVIVTNEVFSECKKDTPEMIQYKKILGEINKRTAAMADTVTEVVYGIPVTLKKKSGAVEKPDEDITPPSRIKMVIGGAGHGKLLFARKRYGDGHNNEYDAVPAEEAPVHTWTDGAVCGFEEVYTCEGIYHFEVFIRRMMEEGNSLLGFAAAIAARNPGVVIVTEEIGCGLVPADAFQREYREQTGRICTELASLSSQVTRVVYGIGIRLKGEDRS